MSKLSAIVVVLLVAAGANAALVDPDSPVVAIENVNMILNYAGPGNHVLYFDVVLVSEGVWDPVTNTGWGLPNFEVGVDPGVTVDNVHLYNNVKGWSSGVKILTGDATANHPSFNVDTAPAWNKSEAATWNTLVAPGTYAFRDYGSGDGGVPPFGVPYSPGTMPTSSTVGSDPFDFVGNKVLTEEILDNRVKGDGYIGADVQVGEIVARFYVPWDGTEITLGNSLLIHLQGTGSEEYAGFRMNPEGLGPSDNGNRYVNVLNNDLIIPIPEPATMGLLGLGLFGLVIRRKK